jgi:hypothetical protein
MKVDRIWIPVLAVVVLAMLGTVSPAHSFGPCDLTCNCTRLCNLTCDAPGVTCGSAGYPCGGRCVALVSPTLSPELTCEASVIGIDNLMTWESLATPAISTLQPEQVN